LFVLEGFGTSALGLLLLLLLYDLEECNRRLAFGEEEEYVALSRFFIAVLEFGDFVVGELEGGFVGNLTLPSLFALSSVGEEGSILDS